MKNAKDEVIRLEKYIERLNNELKRATKPAKIDFFKRDIVKTVSQINKLKGV